MPRYPEEFYAIQAGTVAAIEREDVSLRRIDARPSKKADSETAPGMLNTAVRFTIVTTILLGIAYPLVVTGLAQM
jgi:hypothetical protein